MTLFSLLEEAARRWPEDIALLHDGHSFRYSELYTAADLLAGNLRRAGIQPGDKVGVMCPRGAEYVIAFFAVLRAGGIVATIPPALKAPEVAHLAGEMALDAFCYIDKFDPRIPEGDGKGVTEALVFQGRTPLRIKFASTRSTPAGERDQLLKLDVACIGFSSGTTAKAKGIVFSHATLLERASTRWQPPIPRHSGLLWLRAMDRGVPYQIYGSLLEGAKVLIADSVALGPLPRLLKEHNVDRIYAGPLFFRLLSQEPIRGEALRGVRYFVSGTGPLPDSVANAFRVRFGREIVQTYGMGECGTVLFNTSENLSKRGSVGTPVGGYEIKLLCGEPGQSGRDAVGELLVRGPGMFDAYYKPWRLREEVLEDGWFRTGDIARRDADGYYWIVGRTKDVINVGGVKVFPYEIEEALLSHPAVEEAVVYGVPEGRFGEVVRAKVKLRGGNTCTERKLLRYANERLSVFKALHGVEFVDEIPKTAAGKVRRWD